MYPEKASDEYSSHYTARYNQAWTVRLSYCRQNCRYKTSCPACRSSYTILCLFPCLYPAFSIRHFFPYRIDTSGHTIPQTWNHSHIIPYKASAVHHGVCAVSPRRFSSDLHLLSCLPLLSSCLLSLPRPPCPLLSCRPSSAPAFRLSRPAQISVPLPSAPSMPLPSDSSSPYPLSVASSIFSQYVRSLSACEIGYTLILTYYSIFSEYL